MTDKIEIINSLLDGGDYTGLIFGLCIECPYKENGVDKECPFIKLRRHVGSNKSSLLEESRSRKKESKVEKLTWPARIINPNFLT